VTARRSAAYRQASSVLTRERFIQLYEERHSLRDIAAMVGVPSTVAELARDTPPVRKAGGRRRIIIDRDWLHTHVTKGVTERTRPERRMSVSVASWPHGPGAGLFVPQRYCAKTTSQRTARLTNQGMERSKLAGRSHTSLTAAARQLNISHCTRPQIRLERDLGRPVLIRATDRRPLKLTKFGEQVVAAVHDLASCGGPSSRSTD
jgi:hypothetical protein